MTLFKNALSGSTRALLSSCETVLNNGCLEIYPSSVLILSRLYEVEVSLARQAKKHLNSYCVIKGVSGVSDFECVCPVA